MRISNDHYILSIDELKGAFDRLPKDSSNGIYESIPFPIEKIPGQPEIWRLKFDWNDGYKDWELSPGQNISITSSTRKLY